MESEMISIALDLMVLTFGLVEEKLKFYTSRNQSFLSKKETSSDVHWI